jgi:hypothetical protein
MKGIKLNVIREDLVPTLGQEAVTSFSVTKYVQDAQFAPKIETVSPDPTEG